MDKQIDNHVNFAAAIVLYNPDLKQLQKNIQAIAPQVRNIVVVDNHSADIDSISALLNNYEDITLLRNKENLGIATALNQAATWAAQQGVVWLLTLDQDTICPSNLIATYDKYLHMDDMIGMVCPYMIDINVSSLNEYKQLELPLYEYVKECITSGSFMKLSIWEELGGFEDKLFIDYVDFEYCRHMQSYGYKIIRINESYILHEVGKSTPIKLLGRDFVLFNHNHIRKYYYFRNRVYVYRKYKNETLVRELVGIAKAFVSIIFEEDCIQKFWWSLKGLVDGMTIQGHKETK